MSAEVKATVEEILNDFRQSSIIIHATGSVKGVEEDVRAFEASLKEAKAALDKHYMQEFLEIIGEDDFRKPSVSYLMVEYRNELRQELRDAVTKKWGKG